MVPPHCVNSLPNPDISTEISACSEWLVQKYVVLKYKHVQITATLIHMLF